MMNLYAFRWCSRTVWHDEAPHQCDSIWVRAYTHAMASSQGAAAQQNEGPLISELVIESTLSPSSAENNSKHARIHIVASDHTKCREDVANTINPAPGFPVDRREFGDPPEWKWRKYRDPNNNLIWFGNDVSSDWFYATKPHPWYFLFPHENHLWWWNAEACYWFYEPAS